MIEMKSTLKIDGKDSMTFILANQENPKDALTIRYKRKS
jgi:hypothetical protein